MIELRYKEMDNLFCPVTGQQVLDPEQFHPSPALVFNYIDFEEGLLEYLREDLQRKFSEYYKDEQYHSILYKILTEKELKNSSRYLWITLEGHLFEASFCFDMNYENEKSEDNSHPFYDLKSFNQDPEDTN